MWMDTYVTYVLMRQQMAEVEQRAERSRLLRAGRPKRPTIWARISRLKSH